MDTTTQGLGSNLNEPDAPMQLDGAYDPITSPRVRIILERNATIPPTGQFFGVNGRSYILRPGEPADVPQEIVDVLNNAIEAVPERDPVSQQVVGYQNQLRFPYRIVNPS